MLRAVTGEQANAGGVRASARFVTGGKSELHSARCRVTPGEGDLEESATEKKPPTDAQAAEGKGETVG